MLNQKFARKKFCGIFKGIQYNIEEGGLNKGISLEDQYILTTERIWNKLCEASAFNVHRSKVWNSKLLSQVEKSITKNTFWMYFKGTQHNEWYSGRVKIMSIKKSK